MFLKVARAVAKPQTFAIMDLLKRSTGMSVNEIAKCLKLSYMGVKQYCNELERKGLLDNFRRPKDIGRPEKLYRLTSKAAAFYPEVGNELTLDILESVQQLYGPTAPDKLLFNFFSKKADGYLKRVKGTSVTERAASFARIRESEGYCSQVEYAVDNGFQIVEFHSTLKEIMSTFPSVKRMEELMFTRILGAPVVRTEERISGLTKITFQIPTLINQSEAVVQTEAPVEEVAEAVADDFCLIG